MVAQQRLPTRVPPAVIILPSFHTKVERQDWRETRKCGQQEGNETERSN